MKILTKTKQVVKQITDSFISCNICLENQDYAQEGIEIKGVIKGYSEDENENTHVAVAGVICCECFREIVLPLFPKGIQEDWESSNDIMHVETLSSEEVEPPFYQLPRDEE